MILPDVNVLIYAFRREATDHARYRHWLDSIVNSAAVYALSPQVLSSVIRILTDRRAFRGMYPLDEVLAFANLLLNQPNCQVVQPGARHWPIFHDLCRQSQATGDLVPDAWFAALAIEHGCEWITTDYDFARFPALRWRTPF